MQIDQQFTTEPAPISARDRLGTTSTAWQLAGISLVLRLLTSLRAAFVSPLHPLTEREKTIAFWPPSLPLGNWLERVLLSPWERWDTTWYMAIIQHGYRVDDGTAHFHPLLPC